MLITEIHWIILGYLAIGLAFVEGIRWAREKWRVPPMGEFATGLVFVVWPIVIFIAGVLTWRSRRA